MASLSTEYLDDLRTLVSGIRIPSNYPVEGVSRQNSPIVIDNLFFLEEVCKLLGKEYLYSKAIVVEVNTFRNLTYKVEDGDQCWWKIYPLSTEAKLKAQSRLITFGEVFEYYGQSVSMKLENTTHSWVLVFQGSQKETRMKWSTKEL